MFSPAIADEERGNRPIVAASHDGECYAKAVPADLFDQIGKTTIYAVEVEHDRPIESFEWYSRAIHLACGVYLEGKSRVLVVRLGPWSRGSEASDDDLALEFYSDGDLKARYSTLDIAGSQDNVHGSVSHYVVFREVSGFGFSSRDQTFGFFATRVDGQRLFFDPKDGHMRLVADDF